MRAVVRCVASVVIVCLGLFASSGALIAEDGVTASPENGAAKGSASQSRPNIIVIFADDWGWGDLGCHGSPFCKTPNLDKFAAKGTDFQRFVVASGVCSPSRTALVTGRFPARYSIHQHFAEVAQNATRGMPDWLTPDTVLLPRLLKEAGYSTGHFGKWHLTNNGCPDAPLPEAYGYDASGVFNGPGPQVSANPNKAPVETDRAIEFIRSRGAKPFFVNLWLHASHTPHYPTDRWMKEFGHLDKQHQVYASVIAEADEQIGKLLATLDELKLADNTIVIFSSDNGPEDTGKQQKRIETSGEGEGTFYSVGTTGGLRGQKRSLYQGGVNTPLLVRWPGVTPAGAIDKTTLITAVDILPTLCDAAGVALPKDYQADGEDMLSALQGKTVERSKPIFWEWRGGSSPANWPRLGVSDGKWSLLMTYDGKRVELYDLLADRSQKRNVAESHPNVVQELQAKVLAWKQSLPESPAKDCVSKSRKSQSK